jgi:hypothetical protein
MRPYQFKMIHRSLAVASVQKSGVFVELGSQYLCRGDFFAQQAVNKSFECSWQRVVTKCPTESDVHLLFVDTNDSAVIPAEN